jgi:hypothetical protein
VLNGFDAGMFSMRSSAEISAKFSGKKVGFLKAHRKGVRDELCAGVK